MIEKMRGDEGKHDEARDEPQPLQHIAAGENMHWSPSFPGRIIRERHGRRRTKKWCWRTAQRLLPSPLDGEGIGVGWNRRAWVKT